MIGTGIVGVVAVRRHRRCVDQPPWPLGGDGRFEHIARARQVDPSAFLARPHDDEGQVHHDVDIGDQRIDGIAIEDVALQVDRLRPTPLGGIERPPRHADDLRDVGMGFERLDRRDPDLPSRAGDRNA